MILNNYTELRNFIDENFDTLTSAELKELIKVGMGTLSIIQLSKEELLKQMDHFNKTFGHLPMHKKPQFLFQKTEVYSVKDLYRHD